MRKPLQRLLLVLIGLVVGLFGAELAIRVGAFDPIQAEAKTQARGDQQRNCIRPAPHVGYEFVPGQCGTNSHGFKGRNHPLVKGPGRYRILALGDSITEQRAWVEILELLLVERADEGVQFWNMGVTGYSLLNELELLRHRGLEFDPDMVLLQVCLNDYGVTPVFYSYGGEIRTLRIGTGIMSPTSLWLFERSALFRYLLVRKVGYTAGGVPSAEHLERVDDALREMKALCDARGIPFHVLLFPTLRPKAQWSPNETVAYERFTALADSGEVSMLDLTDIMLTGQTEDLRRYRGRPVFAELERQLEAWGLPPSMAGTLQSMDSNMLGITKPVQPHQHGDYTHPNFLGHAIAADAMAERIEGEVEAEMLGRR